MNDLTCDIGYKSINHAGEQLCGDHVEVVEQEDGSTVIVLAHSLKYITAGSSMTHLPEYRK